jgi:hypothetical protein
LFAQTRERLFQAQMLEAVLQTRASEFALTPQRLFQEQRFEAVLQTRAS